MLKDLNVLNSIMTGNLLISRMKPMLIKMSLLPASSVKVGVKKTLKFHLGAEAEGPSVRHVDFNTLGHF